MRSVDPLLDGEAPRRIISVRDARSVATRRAFTWPRVLLEAGRNDVAEVDDVRAFADQAHFTRFFERQFGVTPGALRRSQRR